MTPFGFDFGRATRLPFSPEIMSCQPLLRLVGRAFCSLINYLTCCLLRPVTGPLSFCPFGRGYFNFLLFLLSLAQEYVMSKSTVLELPGWRRLWKVQIRKEGREEDGWRERERDRERGNPIYCNYVNNEIINTILC